MKTIYPTKRPWRIQYAVWKARFAIVALGEFGIPFGFAYGMAGDALVNWDLDDSPEDAARSYFKK